MCSLALRKDKSYRKVPVAIIDGVQVNGSDDIIQYLLSSSPKEQKNLIVPKEEFVSSPWIAFANDELAPILYPNLCSTLTDSYRAFGYVHNISNFSILQRYLIQSLGSLAMYLAASRIKRYVPLFAVCVSLLLPIYKFALDRN